MSSQWKVVFHFHEENPMNRTTKYLSIFALLALLSLSFATPAGAFDGRSGDVIVIEADEVINDDLYVTAQEFTLNGTVNGDLVAFGQTVIINGTVEGDLAAFAQTVIVNGTVTDDARIAGAALQLGETASIGDDLIAAGASLETKDGTAVEGELAYGGGQALLTGDVTGDVLAGTAALELRGLFGGNVQAFVDANEDTQNSPPMTMFMYNIPISIPSLQPGLTVSDRAKVAGDLEYTSTVDLPIPSGVVTGEIIRTAPAVSASSGATRDTQPTAAQKVGTWVLGIVRGAITLILFGLLLGWLFPALMQALPEKIRSQFLPSLGWGAIAWAGFFFTLFVIVVTMILGGVVFGLLTLGAISGTIVWSGLVSLFALLVGFVLFTSYVTKVVVGQAIGKSILARTSPALAEHKVWPMIIGVLVIVFVVGLLRFPLLPLGFIAWLVNFVVILLGLGALWLRGRDTLRKPGIA